jgi:hypothetical protein
MNDLSIDEIEELSVVLGLPGNVNQLKKNGGFLESCYGLISN